MKEKIMCNVALITNYMKKHNFTEQEFCKLCNISPNSLKTIYRGDVEIWIR